MQYRKSAISPQALEELEKIRQEKEKLTRDLVEQSYLSGHLAEQSYLSGHLAEQLLDGHVWSLEEIVEIADDFQNRKR